MAAECPGDHTYQPHNEKGKLFLFQQHLLLLLHADKCVEVEVERAAQGMPNEPCMLPHCGEMKSLLKHMATCEEEDDDCGYLHCRASWQIVKHWKNCKNEDCPVCRSFADMRPRLEDFERTQPTSLRQEDIKKSCNLMIHSSTCEVDECNTPYGSCTKMKRVMKHFTGCKKRPRGDCPVCGSYIGLSVAHAKKCELQKCPVPLCDSVREKLQERVRVEKRK